MTSKPSLRFILYVWFSINEMNIHCSMSIFHQEEEQPGWQLCRQDLTPEELKDNETLT